MFMITSCMNVRRRIKNGISSGRLGLLASYNLQQKNSLFCLWNQKNQPEQSVHQNWN